MRFFTALVALSGAVAAVAACGSDGGGGTIGGGGSGAGGSDSGVGGSSTGGGGGVVIKCTPGAVQCAGDIPQSCQINGTWVGGTPCPFTCVAGECSGTCKPGSTQCKYGKVQKCGTNGEWEGLTDCEFGCDTGVCKTGCTAGEFNCYGNDIQKCDPGPPSKWTPTGTTCSPTSGQKCDKASGTCKPVDVVGSTTPTGKYYQFGIFQANTTAFKGGYDVTSWGDYVYVNRSTQFLDVYKITLVDSDGDGVLEPNQHPDNPDATGPIEQRTIELVKSYAKAAPDNAPLGSASVSSLHAQSNDKIFSLGPAHNGAISEYVFATAATSVVVQPSATSIYMSFLGWGFGDSTWYAGNEGARRVYSWHAPTKAWVAEFGYPDMAGSHMDGMEVVVSPKTKEQYVYVSDMTSEFIGQYKRGDNGGWVQEKLYEYNDSTKSMVEGFGFGTLSHFWATGGTYLYELGGGDIQKDLDPCPSGKQACGPNYPECPTGQYCKTGCCAKGVR